MILTLSIGFAALAIILAVGLDGIRKVGARSANAQLQMADALSKIADQLAVVEMRRRDIQVEQLKLGERVAAIKNEDLRRESEDMIAKGARVLDG
jgi:hypothetical protein